MNTNEFRLYTRIINFVVNEQYQLNVNVLNAIISLYLNRREREVETNNVRQYQIASVSCEFKQIYIKSLKFSLKQNTVGKKMKIINNNYYYNVLYSQINV